MAVFRLFSILKNTIHIYIFFALCVGVVSSRDLDWIRIITTDLHQNIQLLNGFETPRHFESAWLLFSPSSNKTGYYEIPQMNLFPSTVTLILETIHKNSPTLTNPTYWKFGSEQNELIYTMSEKNPCEISEHYQILGKVVLNHGIQICSGRNDDLYQLVFPRGRRHNYNQAYISVVTYEVEDVPGYVDPRSGIMIGNQAAESTLRDLQFMFNFRVTLEVMLEIDQSNVSYFAPLAGKLNSGQAELGIGYFYVVKPRVAIATPLIPLYSDGLFAFFGQPPSNTVRNIYTEPLRWSIPTTITTLLIFIGGIIVVFKNSLEQDESSTNLFWDVILWTVSSLCHSGYIISSRKTSLRILLFVGAILGFSLYSMYSAKLLSVLMVAVKPIQRLDDLIKHGYTFYAIPAVQHVVFNSETRNLNERSNTGNDAWTESLMAVLAERHAHIDVKLDSARGFLWVIRSIKPPTVPPTDGELCRKVSTVRYSSTNVFLGSGFYVPKFKGSTLRSHFNLGIAKIRETGLLKRYLEYTGPPGLSCPSKKTSYHEDLGLEDVLSAILLYTILFLGSGIFFLCEIFACKKCP